MQEKQIFATLLFAACVARLECKWPLLGRDWDIREFLKTEEPIWTYATSEATQIICKRDTKLLITFQYIVFFRSYYHQKRKLIFRLQGEFDLHRKARMIIKSRDRVFNQTEEVIYMSKNLTCAVMRVTPHFGSYMKKYDLRIRNSTIREPIEAKCLDTFKSRTGKKMYVLYKNKCQYLP
uniref:Putative lipocalin n=1 Tax=Rhipicephalus microplus TaxID=6941 RepID=A0A6G5A4X1_RHIMP